MSEIAIVVVGYNRSGSINRLLNELSKGKYKDDKVDLIISIDNSGTNDVYEVADEFKWDYGEKIIKTYKTRQGLKQHILQCGHLTQMYKGIIMFEDDIVPSKYFYIYAKQAIEFYENDDRIAGISLYKHMWNVGINLEFIPEEDIGEVYFMQYAQSWGQVWTKKMWNNFYKWYEKNSEEFDKKEYLPNNVCEWPKSSWLKFFIKYTVEEKKFFVYPNRALSTNFGEIGENNDIKISHYQVPLQNHHIEKYNFTKLDESKVKYDVFFERMGLAEHLGLKEEELCTDLYGLKENKEKKRYLLTLENKNYKIIKSFGYTMKPHENNIIYNIEGKDIFLYDTSKIVNNKMKKDVVKIKKILHSTRDLKLDNIILLKRFIIKTKIKEKIKKIMR